MTAKKIKKILTDTYGISNPMDSWIKLSGIFSIIYLSQDTNIYINDDELYYFDSADEALYISKSNSYKKLTADEIKDSLMTYPISMKTGFDCIGGFINTSASSISGIYLTRKF